MDSISSDRLQVEESEVAQEFPPFLNIYKDGRVVRLLGTEKLPPSHDPRTNVDSRDVEISTELGISARLYLPKITNQNRKLPLFVYFPGGGFCIESPFSPTYHNHLNLVVSQANVVAVSVDYRKAPEFPVPIGHEDSWIALKWVASHFNGNGPDEWLNRYADLGKVFLAGDSAGANIAHHMAIRVGTEGLEGVRLEGLILVHACFMGDPVELLSDSGWRLVCPTSSGTDDPIINPGKDPKLKNMGCTRVLILVAGKDMFFREWNLYYKDLLEKSGWPGVVELIQHEEEGHVFHLQNPGSENAHHLLNSLVSFINNG